MSLTKGQWQNPAAQAGALVALVLTFVVPVWIVKPDFWAWGWAISAGSLLVFCLCIGIAINGRLGGLIIDARNKMSLSKLQAVAWTILVLSAWIAFVVTRARLGATGPEDVVLPPELLAAMGISATSLVAAPVILSLKAPDTVHTNDAPGNAQWLDLFRGDDVGNANSPDLGKIQQFLITVVVLAVYAGDIWNTLGAPAALVPHSKNIDFSNYLHTLPVFNANLAWLIGISHAGYLAYKAAPHPGNTAAADTGTDDADDVAAG
jgi:hypothetical protein